MRDPDARPAPPLRCDLPPEAALRVPNIVRVDPGQPTILICLSRAVYGFATHYHEQRTRPCVGAWNDCPYCMFGSIIKWEGWLCVQRVYGRCTLWVALTAHCVRTCPELTAGTRSLRGAELLLRREGATHQTRMSLAIASRVWGEPMLFPEACPAEFLSRLWGIDKALVKESLSVQPAQPADQQPKPPRVETPKEAWRRKAAACQGDNRETKKELFNRLRNQGGGNGI